MKALDIYLVFSKMQIMFWFSEGIGGGLFTLLMLISAYIEFGSVIYCNLCLLLGFIYLSILVRGSFTLRRLFH